MSALVSLLAGGFASAFVAAALPGRVAALFGALTALVLFGMTAMLAPGIAAGGASLATFWSVPALGIAGGLKLDGLSLVFALLITGIGALVFLYAHAYLAGDHRLVRLVVILLLFMSAMVGAVTSDDVITLFIFWELTSLTSFFLVGFDHEKPKARKAALQALLVTGGGGLALLAGLILVSLAAGTTSLSGIIAAREAVVAYEAATAAMLLIIFGCFAKSAQAPLHFWLPNAMAAPTPVSAYLHSATMVKLGVYLLARFNPVYQNEALWGAVLTTFGGLTMITATVLAFRETDLKRVLAYTTVTALGTLVMLIGIAPELSITAAVTFLVVHAFYKAALFMIAGIVDHETGTRDASQLGGLARHMPFTAAAALLAALSMAGLPPFVGFVAKELIYEAKLELGAAQTALLAISFLVNSAAVAIAGVLSLRLFFGRARQTPEQPHDPPVAMWVGPFILACLGLTMGAMPASLGAMLVDPAVSAILGRPADVALKLWHGFNAVLALSIATVALGMLLFLAWERIVPRLRSFAWIDDHSASAAYDRGLAGLLALAERCTLAIQHGSLRGYVRTLFLAAAVAAAGALLWRDGLAWPADSISLDPRHLPLALIMLGSAAVMAAPTAVTAALALGLVGFGAAVVFLSFGAPDVAFTQFAVETLLVVILATALIRLPVRGRDLRTPREKVADLCVALFCGVAIAAVLAAVLASPFDSRLTEWFSAQSVPAAHGRNVVNVILVDFRALDTLGEIVVLALSAFAVVALLRRPRTASAPAPRLETGS